MIQKLIKNGKIKVNGVAEKANYIIKDGDGIEIEIPEPEKLSVEAENIPLEIVYEDEMLAVINKPRGMVVHPAPGNYSSTLVNALLFNCDNLSGINGVLRPGIVHRLDKDTSGLIVVAKNDIAHASLSKQISEKEANREYLALVHGIITSDHATVDAPIGRDENDRKKMAVTFKNSKNAITDFFVIERFEEYTYVRAVLKTGRTHQIRVHMAYMGHPVVGDDKYGRRKNEFLLHGQFLHAYRLRFRHPLTDQYMDFQSPLPSNLNAILIQLQQRKNT